MANLYLTLETKQKYRRPFSSSDDFKYFIENREKLGKFKTFLDLFDSEENEFNIIRANIILKGLENKILLEEEIDNIKNRGDIEHSLFITTLRQRIIDQPYYQFGNNKIYIPFFSVALNQIYIDEPEKMLSLPYSELTNNFEDSCIDPFDTYGADLFNSYFTSLLKIASYSTTTAFFHYDTNTIYMVNNQGRLDNKIVLFDKYMKNPTYTHMLERISPVIEAYFHTDRQKMVDALLDNKLISPQMHKILTENKR